MPFIPITAIDGFNRSVLVGYAMVRQQNAESFIWVLEQLKVHLPPNAVIESVITDQDAAIGLALSTSLPHTKHILCK